MTGVPKVDFPLDRFELLILRTVEGAARLDAATVQKLQAEHVAYLLGLQRAGKLLAAGAVAPREKTQPINGLGFFQLGSVDIVRELIEKDPSVVGGLDSAEVLQFICPKGSLSFPSVV